MVHVAAVDLGASSGRVVLGEVGPDRLHLEVVARLANDPVRTDDGLHWDLSGLYDAALGGLQAAVSASPEPLAGVAIDSWAVDYGLLREGRLLGQPFHYRDEARAAGVETVHAVQSHEALYPRNGLQFLPFNSLYQLAADPLAAQADRMLLVPDLLGYWLTGVAVTERTNASTTGLLDVRTGKWDRELIDLLGLPAGLFGDLVDPGTVVGPVLASRGRHLGAPGLTVTTVGSHDTASAVVGVPMASDHAAYLSCGTWGLVGVELPSPVLTDAAREANFTNEGGVDGRVRYLRNLMGMWLLSESVRTWQRDGQTIELPELLTAAAAIETPLAKFDPNDPSLMPAGDMPSRISALCATSGDPVPSTPAEFARSIVESLAEAYATTLDEAEQLSGIKINTVHIVGGGSQNALLCQLTADRTGRTVLAGPVEATAIGNVLVQGRAAGFVSGSLEDLRGIVAETFAPIRYEPTSGRTP